MLEQYDGEQIIRIEKDIRVRTLDSSEVRWSAVNDPAVTDVRLESGRMLGRLLSSILR